MFTNPEIAFFAPFFVSLISFSAYLRTLFLFFMLLSAGYAELTVSPEALNKNLEMHILFSDDKPNPVGHIYIGGHDTQISQGTFIYIKNALEYFREKVHPIFIILELDTPGGEVFPAQKISDALKEMDTNDGIPVVAFINNWAISAGAMLGYSCRYIATVKDGIMGAAQPVMQSGEKTSEKVNSAIRSDFGARALFFDRNPLIAEAMVDPDRVLVVRDGKIMELNSNEEILKSDHVITRKGKLLTLNGPEMLELGVAQFLLPPKKTIPLTEQERATGEWSSDHELLFTAPFFKDIPNVVIKSYQMDWKTRFFTILSHPMVTALLFLGLLVGFYVEISTGGFGVAAAIGLLCLALIVVSSFAIQATGWLEYILLGLGIGLLLLEIFVIPGFGVTGILGIIFTAAGLTALLLPGIREVHFDTATNTLNAAGEYLLHRLGWLGAALIIGVILIALLTKYLAPRFALFSPLIHRGEQDAEQGYVAGLNREGLPQIGAEGVVVSPLRTAGKVEIEGQVYDAVSSGGFIDKGERIKIIGIEGSKIIVQEIV